MPHGTGHVGGGHHGGGFGGGGGGFHHHHHHGGGFQHRHHHHLGHHHHHGWGWWGWGGPYTPYYGYRRRGFGWIIAVLFVIIFAVILSISLGLRYGTDSNDLDTAKEYALTDKVIRSYKSDFCQGLQARSTDTPNNFQSTATLYLLNSRPPLTDRESFNLTETAHLTYDTNYHVWNFYLNAGSKVSVSACYTSDDYNAKFYLIKGNSNHNKWLGDPDSSYSVLYKRLSSQCTNAVSYQAHQDDLYFFVFYMDADYYHTSITLNINFSFDRTVYHISQDMVAQNCSFPLDGHSSCSLSVPMSSSYTAVLSLNTSLPVDYNDGANVRIDCQPRAWLYAVIVVCTVVPVIVIIVSVVTFICFKVRKGKKKYSSLTTNSASTSTDTTSQTNGNATATESMFAKSSGGSSSSANPPPFNPAYSPASGGYGATVTGPPPPYTQ